MISSLLLVGGVGVLALGLRTYRHPVLYWLGTVGIVVTSFLGGWLIGESLVLGAIFGLTWFALPWFEILTRIRRLRLPMERRLMACTPPSQNTFPGFLEISDEMEEAGFEYCEDAGWEHDTMRQFYRFYYNDRTRTLASISLIEQGSLAFYYVEFSSKAMDGRIFMTWNYPFSYGLHLHPKIYLNRGGGWQSIAELMRSHAGYLARSFVRPEDLRHQVADRIRDDIQNEMRELVEHNLTCGILKREPGDMIRYSVRGMLFLWFQFLRDFGRIS